MPACPSLMCSFNRGNIEGTNSSLFLKFYVGVGIFLFLCGLT